MIEIVLWIPHPPTPPPESLSYFCHISRHDCYCGCHQLSLKLSRHSCYCCSCHLWTLTLSRHGRYWCCFCHLRTLTLSRLFKDTAVIVVIVIRWPVIVIAVVIVIICGPWHFRGSSPSGPYCRGSCSKVVALKIIILLLLSKSQFRFISLNVVFSETRLFAALWTAWPKCTSGPRACGALAEKVLLTSLTESQSSPLDV